MELIQVGMRTGAMEGNFSGCFVNFIDEYPVTLDVTVTRAFPFSVNRMIFVFRWQWLFLYDQVDNFMEFTQIPALFLHQLELLLERFLKMKIKHCVTADGRLTVHLLIQEGLPNFFKFLRFMPFYRNFSAQNSLAFLNSGGGFGVKKLFPGYGVAVRGTNGTFALIAKPVIIKLVLDIRRGGFRDGIGRPLVWSLCFDHGVSVA